MGVMLVRYEKKCRQCFKFRIVSETLIFLTCMYQKKQCTLVGHQSVIILCECESVYLFRDITYNLKIPRLSLSNSIDTYMFRLEEIKYFLVKLNNHSLKFLALLKLEFMDIVADTAELHMWQNKILRTDAKRNWNQQNECATESLWSYTRGLHLLS